MRIVNLRPFFFVFYVIIPTAFYALPLLLFEFNYIEILKFHAWGDLYVSTYDSCNMIIFTFIAGLIFYTALSNLDIEIVNSASWLVFFCFLLCSILLILRLNSYLDMVLLVLLIYVISNYKLTALQYSIFCTVGLLDLLLNSERYLIIQMILFYLIVYSRMSLKNVLLLTIFLIVIGQPLKYIIKDDIDHTLTSFEELYNHLNPLYVGNYLAMYTEFSFAELVAEYIPFGKSLLATGSIVDKIAINHLPYEIYDAGTRFGSYNSIYFGYNFLHYIVIVSIFYLLINKFAKRRVANAIAGYLIFYAPMFMRRNLGSYLIDVFILVAICFFIPYKTQQD